MVRPFSRIWIIQMLGSFRKFANTWPARIFFLILVLSFASWGVADVVRSTMAGSNAVATVLGHDVSQNEFLAEYRTGMQRYAQQLPDPSQAPPELRHQVAQLALNRLVTQAALADQIKRLGIVVPDSAVRDAVYDMSEFKGPDGKFSQVQLRLVLQQNNLNEAHFLDLVRQDIAQNQILQTVSAQAAAPSLLTGLVYKYINEKRRADIVFLPFEGGAPPAAPSDDILKRFYQNNPKNYSSPEYRHIKAVILSPDTIGRGIAVTDAEIKTWFTQHKSDYVAPEKRNLQIITAGTPAVAAKLAAEWQAGSTWEKMQASATAAGATAVKLDDATPVEIPSPTLAKAAFAAPAGNVQGPISDSLSSYVFKVASITPAKNPTFESLHDELRAKVAASKALDLIDARAQKLQDLFAGGAKIDEVPSDLGAAGAEGTLDAKGNTLEGTPAPLPATGDLRQSVIDAAFKAKPGDPIEPTEGPNHAWYAVAVDSITKPAERPFAQVRDKVLADWQADQIHHNQDEKAAHILQLVKAGQPLIQVARAENVQVARTPPLNRDRPTAGIPAELVHSIFALKIGEATMAETNKGFVVAQLAEILPPDETKDKIGLDQTKTGLAHALHDDYLQIYASALRDAAKPVVRPAVVEGLIQSKAAE